MELLLLRLFTLCLLLSAQWVDGICPFQCSGHGTCVGAFCECLTGYTGVICSERTCPRNNAWIAKPFEIVDDPATGTFYAPRPQAECSNKGKCNRATGQCRCFRGFEGDACERTTCGASKCSGHGQCVPSYYLLRTKFQSYLPEPDFKYYTNWETYQNSLPEPVYKYYTNWESNQTTACVCQIGFTGPDCSYRICPKAADPYHKFTQYPTIQISIYDETGIKSGPTGPTFLFTFQGQSFAFNPRRWTMDKCRSLFQSLPNIESVNCTIVSIYGYTRTFQVVFTSFPLLPYENNLFMNDGDPNKWALDCIDTTLRRPGQTWCNIEIINTTASVPGYKFCADRGICDFSTGVCDCFLNSHGVACEQLTYVPLPPPAVVVQDLLLLNVTRRGFNGSDLSLLTTYYGDDAFNHILIEELNVTIMQLTGGGDWIMQTGGLTIKGLNNTLYAGQTIALGGLTVTGGTSVTSGGLVLSRGNLNVQGAGLAVNGGLTSASSLNLTGSIYVASGVTLGYPGLRIKNSLNVRAGGMTIALGGVTVTGGVSIASGGLLILKRGMTINNGGLVINGGLYLKGPNNLMMNSISGGLTVGGGFAVTGGITIFNVGLTVNGGATILSNGLHAKVGLTVLNSGIFTSQGLTVQDTGLYLTSGVTISGSLMIPDGIKITASGLSVSSNGLFLETTPTILNGLVTSLGGLTVVDTGVVITTGGMSVFSTGFIVSNSLTINGGLVSLGGTNIVNAGGVVTNTGLTIIAGGLQVTGGLTVKNVGLSIVTGGLSVFNNGIMISTGLTIRSAGLMLSNGLTIRAAGLRITQGLTIAQGGLNMLSGSVSIRSGGLNVASGLTLNYGGAVVATGGLSINGGLISSQALTVADIGLVVVTGGLTVADSGLIFAAGSLTINRGLVASSTVGSLSVMGSGLVVVTGGMTIPAPGLAISSGLSVMNNGLIITGGLTLSNSNLALPSGGLTNNGPVRIANGFSVQDSGVRLTGGLTLSNNGLSIVTGGLTVANNGLNVLVLTTANNGLYITGGLTVNGPGGVNRVSGGLTITAGNFFVNTASLSQGIVVQSGLSVVNGAITAGGLTVFTGGINAPTLSVNFGGLASSNAVSVRSGGLVTSNGLTVSDTGLIITNGLTIVGGGMIVPDTLRVRRGAISTDVLTVGDVGVIATGGITIGEGGLLLTGGLTVPFANIMTGGLTVADAGFAMLGGLTITIADSGMYIEKNLTVYGGTAFNPGYTYTHASDERLKTNIHHIHNSIHKLEQIHGISYTSVDPNDHVKRRYGVIAQEVEQVLPDAIKYLKIDEKIEKKIVHPDYYHQKYSNQIDKKNDDGRYRTVNYIAILPVLVNAVKELLERAEDQNDSLPIESEDCSKEECTSEGEGSLFISTLQSFLAMEVREEDEGGRRKEEGLYDLLTTMIDEISCSCFLRMKSELEHLNDEVDSFQQELTMFRQSLIPG